VHKFYVKISNKKASSHPKVEGSYSLKLFINVQYAENRD